MRQLLIRTKIRSFESVSSLLYRLTQDNFYDYTGRISGLIGLRRTFRNKDLLCDRGILKKLSFINGYSEDEVFNISVHRFARYFSNQNNDVLDSNAMDNFVLHSRTQYCPLCLKESGYHRIFWDLLPVTVCLKHEVILQSVCPKCKSTVTVNWVLRNKCECGEDLLLVNSVSITPHTEAIRNQFFIQNLLGINEFNDPKIVSGIQNSPATDLSTSDFFKVLKLFYTLILKKLPVSSRFLKLGSITAEKHDNMAIKNSTLSLLNFILINSAASILLDWPQKFYEFLEEYSTIIRSERYDTGVGKYFGGIQDAFFDKLDAEKFGFIHYAYAKYLNEHWTGGHLNDRIKVFDILEGRKIQKKYISTGEAIDILGGTDSTITKLIDQDIIHTVVLKSKSKKKYLIDAESVYALKERRDGMLKYSDLACRLDISDKIVRKFIKSGLLSPIKEPWCSSNIHLFEPEEVEKFEKEFLPVEGRSAVDDKPFGYFFIAEAVKKIKINTARLLILVRQGVFNPVLCEGKKGLSKLLFSKNEIEKYRDECAEKRTCDIVLSLYRASVVVGLDMRQMRYLIDIGLIKTTYKNINGEQKTYIQKKDLDEFKSEYSFIDEAAAVMGFDTETVFQWIKQGRLKDYSQIPVMKRSSIRILRREEIKLLIPESLSIPQAAEYLGLSSSHMYRLIRKNILPTLKGKGRGKTPINRIPKEEIVRYSENVLKPTQENYMSLGQAAKYLGVGRSTIYRLRNKKILSTTNHIWKQATLIPLQELEDYKRRNLLKNES